MLTEDEKREIYRQVDLLISNGYLDPSMRKEAEEKLKAKKRETEASPKDDQ